MKVPLPLPLKCSQKGEGRAGREGRGWEGGRVTQSVGRGKGDAKCVSLGDSRYTHTAADEIAG